MKVKMSKEFIGRFLKRLHYIYNSKRYLDEDFIDKFYKKFLDF